jgi:hypothetical protein
VEPKTVLGERRDEHRRAQRVLPAAHRSNSDGRELEEINAGGEVRVDVVEVVAVRPALEHGEERRYDSVFRILPDADAVAEAVSRIEAVARQPAEDYPAPSGAYPLIGGR